MLRHGKMGAAVTALVLAALVATAVADESMRGVWLAQADKIEQATEAKVIEKQARPPEDVEWQKPGIPVGFAVEYAMVSDYIWRGLNFSEFPGEGREGLNHQLTLGISFDLGQFGTVGYSAWFEWYAYQDSRRFGADPDDGHLQEVDHTVYWSYDLSTLNEAIPLSVEVGWIAYVFPQVGGNDASWTHEMYVILALDDSSLFGTEGGVLNPYFALYADLDDVRGQWWELGISHEFALADLGLESTPILKDITITPSLVLGMDHRYFSTPQKHTRLANLLYGLDMSLDLSSALDLPPQVGSFYLNTFLAFSQPLNGELREEAMNDEFFGGMAVGWEW